MHDRRSKPSASSGCHASQVPTTVQPFPEKGVLADHANLPLGLLKDRLGKPQDSTYSYVVASVKMDSSSLLFEQHGSAPNFQGDVLTLCTCKHQMRSSRPADRWGHNVWIAGFTSRTLYEGVHWLYYLTRIEAAYDSQSDLWNDMAADARHAKAAHLNYLGDMFKPKTPHPIGNARFSPTRYYVPPYHAHRRSRDDNGWHNDISYRLASKFRYPPLLVGDSQLTFMWQEPMISLNHDHCRNYRKRPSLQALIDQLQEAQS